MEADDRSLWKSLRGRRASPPACPDANALAAFLDGRLPGQEREALEAHLADCEACLEACLEVRGLATDAVEPVSEPLLRRIRDLVADAKAPKTGPAVRWRLLAPETLAAAAALVVACILGFAAGSQASWDRARAEAAVRSDVSRIAIGPDLADWPGREEAP